MEVKYPLLSLGKAKELVKEALKCLSRRLFVGADTAGP